MKMVLVMTFWPTFFLLISCNSFDVRDDEVTLCGHSEYVGPCNVIDVKEDPSGEKNYKRTLVCNDIDALFDAAVARGYYDAVYEHAVTLLRDPKRREEGLKLFESEPLMGKPKSLNFLGVYHTASPRGDYDVILGLNYFIQAANLNYEGAKFYLEASCDKYSKQFVKVAEFCKENKTTNTINNDQ